MSAICFNLDQSEIVSSDNELRAISPFPQTVLKRLGLQTF